MRGKKYKITKKRDKNREKNKKVKKYPQNVNKLCEYFSFY